uniref:Uncharacterized protein n=1 Tax=Arundo donax TaxID=35708 RepID=A0A0A8YHH8_ARUDO
MICELRFYVYNPSLQTTTPITPTPTPSSDCGNKSPQGHSIEHLTRGRAGS